MSPSPQQCELVKKFSLENILWTVQQSDYSDRAYAFLSLMLLMHKFNISRLYHMFLVPLCLKKEVCLWSVIKPDRDWIRTDSSSVPDVGKRIKNTRPLQLERSECCLHLCKHLYLTWLIFLVTLTSVRHKLNWNAHTRNRPHPLKKACLHYSPLWINHCKTLSWLCSICDG